MTDAVRKEVARCLVPSFGDREGQVVTEDILSAIAGLPLADRLAYARGLVEAEGWVVARVPAEVPGFVARNEWRDGWNACRAAVLASAKEVPDV